MSGATPTFRVGFVASPHPHAAMHLKTLEALPEVERVLCAGVGGQAGAALAEGLTKGADGGAVADLLAPGAVDALVVCARNDLCPALLAAAVEARLPVIFEKPGALRAADLRRVAEGAAARGLTLGTFLQWRGHP